jgi:signal transduction histidine kinase
MWNETIPLLAASANLLLGFLALMNGPDRAIHRNFALLMGLSFIWNFGTFRYGATGDPFWHRFLTFGSAMMPVAALRFSFLYLGVRPAMLRSWTRVLLFASSALVVLTLTPFFETLLFRIILTAYMVALLCGIAVVVHDRYERTRVPLERHRLGYLLAALVITTASAMLDAARNLGLPAPRLANLASLFTSAILSLAIIRHRLLDIQIVLRGSLIFAVLVVMAVPLHSLLYATAHSVSRGMIATEVFILLLATAVIFPWTTRWAQTRLTRAVLGPRSGRRMLLRRVRAKTGEGNATIQDLRAPLEEAREGLGATWLALVGEAGHGRARIALCAGGSAPAFETLATVPAPGGEGVIYRSEVLQGDEPRADLAACVKAMEDAGVELLAPIPLAGRRSALLLAGPRRNGSAFDALDLAFFEELSEEARAVIQSEDTRRALESRSRLAAIGEMSAGVAHEVRNPLAAMKGAVELLRARRSPGGETDESLLTLLATEAERLERVVNDFLEYARPAAPRLAPERLDHVARKTVELLEKEARSNGIELGIEKNGEVPPVLVDAEQLRQVLINLIQNAAHAMDGVGRVTLVASAGTGEALLSVRDTGPGFSPDALQRAFDPFFTTRSRGSGLGLAIARRIVENHAGRIQVRNRAEGGAEVTLAFPLAEGRTG